MHIPVHMFSELFENHVIFHLLLPNDLHRQSPHHAKRSRCIGRNTGHCCDIYMTFPCKKPEKIGSGSFPSPRHSLGYDKIDRVWFVVFIVFAAW